MSSAPVDGVEVGPHRHGGDCGVAGQSTHRAGDEVDERSGLGAVADPLGVGDVGGASARDEQRDELVVGRRGLRSERCAEGEAGQGVAERLDVVDRVTQQRSRPSSSSPRRRCRRAQPHPEAGATGAASRAAREPASLAARWASAVAPPAVGQMSAWRSRASASGTSHPPAASASAAAAARAPTSVRSSAAMATSASARPIQGELGAQRPTARTAPRTRSRRAAGASSLLGHVGERHREPGRGGDHAAWPAPRSSISAAASASARASAGQPDSR